MAQLCQNYQIGLPAQNLADRYGIGKTAVTRLLRDHGVPLRYQEG